MRLHPWEALAPHSPAQSRSASTGLPWFRLPQRSSGPDPPLMPEFYEA